MRICGEGLWDRTHEYFIHDYTTHIHKPVLRFFFPLIKPVLRFNRCMQEFEYDGYK
jgi:hypothetical protein